jgi:hypothetical protein
MEYTKEEQSEAFKKTASVKIHILVQIMNIIDIASKRGAFNANELSTIGILYDNISSGVDNAMKLSRQESLQKHLPPPIVKEHIRDQ